VVYGFCCELTVIEYEQGSITGLDNDMSDIGRLWRWGESVMEMTI